MIDAARPPSRLPSLGRRLLVAVLPVAAASLTGALLTAPNIPTWYAGLAKPGFTPPNGLFAPVWTVLYVMMAVAAWRLLTLPRGTPGRLAALTAFFVQLALNALWTPVFFAAHQVALAFLVIVALFVAILRTIRLAWPLDRLAAGLLVPYAAWVAYAALLNAAIWRLNP